MARIALLLLLSCALSLSALAADKPPADPNLRALPYRADVRTEIIGTLRRSTTITFGAGESIVRMILGDDDILEGPDPATLGSTPLRNHLPLWPRKTGRTNFQIVTSSPGKPDRLYQFVITVRDAPADGSDDPEATYGLTFTYPAQAAATGGPEVAGRATRRRDATGRLGGLYSRRLEAEGAEWMIMPPPRGEEGWNPRYIGRGDKILAPYVIADNGVETFLQFHPSLPVPALFVIRRSGTGETEMSVNLERRGLYHVLPGIFEELRLRSGDLVLDIRNVGYQQSLRSGAAFRVEARGTSRPGVVRDIRGRQQ